MQSHNRTDVLRHTEQIQIHISIMIEILQSSYEYIFTALELFTSYLMMYSHNYSLFIYDYEPKHSDLGSLIILFQPLQCLSLLFLSR